MEGHSGDPDDCIVAVKHFSAVVGQSGKEIHVNGCVISFAKGSFKETATVEGKLEIDRSKWPPRYLVITPMIYIKASSKLLTPVSIQAASWCSKDSSAEGENTAHALHLPNRCSTWDVIDVLPLTGKKFFFIDCLDFSPIVVGVPEGPRGALNFRIDVRLFATDSNVFTTSFCLGDRTIIDELERELSTAGFKLLDVLNPIAAKLGHKIGVTFACIDPDSLIFVPSADFTFVVDEPFLETTKVKIKKCRLKCNDVDRIYDATLQFEDFKNDVPINGPQAIAYDWRPCPTSRKDEDNPGDHSTSKTSTKPKDERATQSSPQEIKKDDKKDAALLSGGIRAANFHHCNSNAVAGTSVGSSRKPRKKSVGKKVTSLRKRLSQKKSKAMATEHHKGAEVSIQDDTPSSAPPGPHLKPGEQVTSESLHKVMILDEEEADEDVRDADVEDPKELLRPRQRREWTPDPSRLIARLPLISSFFQGEDAGD